MNLDNVINKATRNRSKDLIIYDLYTSLAPFFERDLGYFLASDDEKFLQYQAGFYNHGRYIVCSTLADFYVKLFNDLGIEALKDVANSAKIPLFVVLVKGEYGWYYLDALNDLFYNQYGLRPVNFGVIPRFKTINRNHPELVRLSRDYLMYLEKSLNKQYLNSYFDELHKSLAHRNNAFLYFKMDDHDSVELSKRKMQFISDNLINIGYVNGPYERSLMYLYLYGKLFDSSERKRVNVFLDKNLYNVNTCISVNNGDVLNYVEIKEDNFVLRRK